MNRFEEAIEFAEIYAALGNAAVQIYSALGKEYGLHEAGGENATGDDQLELDVFADKAFLTELERCSSVRHVVSEERPELVDVNQGRYSVALDPLDGSKSALVGIPSGAIFCIFDDVDIVSEFCGKNVVASGFFVFGLNLEVYFADSRGGFRSIYNRLTSSWTTTELSATLPSSKFFAINTSNLYFWDEWLRSYYLTLLNVSPPEKPHNLRWYASMVSEVKRLILEGGVFAYPGDFRPGYEQGRLRLVYEAIPMAFLIEKLGGRSSDGDQSLLETPVTELHQKTPVFLGERVKILKIEELKRGQ